MRIQEHWKLRDFDLGETNDLEVAAPQYDDYFWMAAEVPGDVHSTLKEHGLIEDPFFGHNDQKCRWVEEKVWWYRTVFQYSGDLIPGEKIALIFEGLDTFATAYLNGVELGSTENMFIAFSFEVTRELQAGANTLAVKFDPVHYRVGSQAVSSYWSGYSKERVWTRKNQSHFGWDWGPRLVTAGIWKEVRLEKRRYAKLDNVYARTVNLNEGQADIEISMDLLVWERNKTYKALIELKAEGETVKNSILPIEMSQGFHSDGAIMGTLLHGTTNMVIEEAKLWWTHDLGTPYLYDLVVTVLADDEAIDTYKQPFGLRLIELKQSDENGEPAFTFFLNGVKVFAKGANWIPIDSFVATVPEQRYKHLIAMSKDAHMNMLRVWGGGIYERDIFYDECDRLGILVWQDFMFACALYPDYNRNFMDMVRREVEQVTKRLRNRTCLALWCGNNENDWLYEALHSNGAIPHPYYGEKINHELMPALLQQLDLSRTFWPSSPYGGNDHNSRQVGDSHNWQVWHGNREPRIFGEPQVQDYSVEGLSFKKFKEDDTKFASEFGMHASANRYTLQRNVPDSKLIWGSKEMMNRNKDINHLKGMMIMEGYTGVPADLEEYINYSMLTQAEGLKYGIEHYRRHKPETSGALFWQLNDCWPGTSWSVIDYYGLPKAAYHYARKFFHPVLLTAEYTPGDQEIMLWALNDTRVRFVDTAHLEVFNMLGQSLFHTSYAVSVEAVGKCQLVLLKVEDLLQGYAASEVVCTLRWASGTGEEQFFYLLDYKEMQYEPAHVEATVNEAEQTVTVTTDRVARMVRLEIAQEWLQWEDNFFDLIPGSSRTIRVKQADGQTIPWNTLSISAMNSQR
ncbi:glycoside hydrolase family 2 protein [Paenibacillus sp. 19GGS1-52]|uniref:beta-mannosidase n=1 Tax=Paenibacillus sp. 19GGS1-52 TaxID=2758563 RepID=UPI001EFC15E0|nr:glycoside hydrolase family 2 protein [Paenibacillus sp. 19GGS1-52]ULO08362.1 glycoside hydrolase family 2 protein [Paenibacillus sp. 19GGS1-52]